MLVQSQLVPRLWSRKLMGNQSLDTRSYQSKREFHQIVVLVVEWVLSLKHQGLHCRVTLYIHRHWGLSICYCRLWKRELCLHCSSYFLINFRSSSSYAYHALRCLCRIYWIEVSRRTMLFLQQSIQLEWHLRNPKGLSWIEVSLVCSKYNL